MSIVLNENEWAYEKIRSRTLGKKPSETLRRVARYYIDSKYPRAEVRNKLNSFLIQCDPLASLPKWAVTLDYAVEYAEKHEAIIIDNIPITRNEMEKINSLNGKQARRLAFTLLCLAKYWKIVIPDSDYWVNSSDSEIMSLANINTSIRRRGLLYSELYEAGLVQFSKKIDSTNLKVLFVQDGDIALDVSDFRNLGYQYLKYQGAPFFECQNCGITVKYDSPGKGRTQKYCKSCATEIAIRQRVNHTMHIRHSSADTSCARIDFQ